jgi:hypothetical protein
MSVAVRGTGVPHWVVVHDVGGLAAGVYRWPGLEAPVRPGALRGELHQVCLGQPLARDAAFVAIAAADIGRLDGREYREAQLDALLFTCVGAPGYISAAAGPPGVPARVRRVTRQS